MATSKQGTIDWLMLGNRISDMRRSRNMTQLELAERLGTSDVYIGYLEQGKRHGTLETFINIVNILGYSIYVRKRCKIPCLSSAEALEPYVQR